MKLKIFLFIDIQEVRYKVEVHTYVPGAQAGSPASSTKQVGTDSWNPAAWLFSPQRKRWSWWKRKRRWSLVWSEAKNLQDGDEDQDEEWKKIRRFCKRNIQVVRHGLFEGPRKWKFWWWGERKMRSVLGMRRRVKEREDRSVGQVKGLPVVHDVYNVVH